MTASDDARHAIARAAITDPEQKWQGRKFGINDVLAAVMPDGRTVGQWLNTVPDLEAEVNSLRAEQERLRAMVRYWRGSDRG